jgi:hypothetical protein
MPALPTPPDSFFVERARAMGLDTAFVPIERAFKELAVSSSFGWEKLVKTGLLPVVRLSPRKTITSTAAIAKVIWLRENEPPARPGGCRRTGRPRKIGRNLKSER